MNLFITNPLNGNTANVNDRYRLEVDSVNKSTTQSSSENGNAYNVNTGYITLTDAAETALMFFQNMGDVAIVIEAFIYNLGVSTGGTGQAFIEAIRNPTTGTIISTATPVDISGNRNFGSNNILDADAFKGATGLTLTNGESFLPSIVSSGTRVVIPSDGVILPKGGSIGFNYTPPSGNTSQIVSVALNAHLLL